MKESIIIECPKCKNTDIKVYWDKFKESHSLCICQNKECCNTGMRYDFDKEK